MISFWTERHNKGCFSKKTPLSFFTDLFRKTKCRGSSLKKKAPHEIDEKKRGASTFSVSVMDMRIISPMPLSPALSLMTLTPGRTRDIDHDMEALRLSRQDNPFLRILASRESLIDVSYESNLDSANLMSQSDDNDIEVDPLSLPEIHEYMIRSPPPTTWPKSPNYKVFKFPDAIPEDSPDGCEATRSGICKEETKGIEDIMSKIGGSTCITEGPPFELSPLRLIPKKPSSMPGGK